MTQTMNRYVADLHIHSYYSRATSKNLNLEQLAKWAQIKGVQLVATGDIAHPGWLAELQEKLEPAEDGLFQLKPEIGSAIQDEVPRACQAPVRFLLGGEISNIYKRHDKVRKVHNLCYFPSFAALERFQATLEKIGNIRADGRPILGLDSRDLLEITLETDDRGYLIPAHIWTPWFAMFGSKSGFDSVEACFGDLSDHIFAVETGLSADPPMCWRVSNLDPYTLISNSDAHSPPKLAREASIFNTAWSYDTLFEALQSGDPAHYLGTLEFYPEEGKYHFDGHRKCGVRWHPQTSIAHDDRCPVCGKPVTVGVMHRVEELADRAEGEQPLQAHSYQSLIPLPEILAAVAGVGPTSKRVQRAYFDILGKLGNELHILLDAPLAKIERQGNSLLAEGIRRMRTGEVNIAGGYDGEFGTITLFAAGEKEQLTAPQLNLFGRESAPADSPPAKSPEQVSGEKPAATTAVAEAPTLYRAAATGAAATTEQPTESTDEPAYLAALNARQRAAVECVDAPVIIVAGPGTGKTRTLTARIAHLILAQDVAPEAVLAITFTNKAAEEMAERLAGLLGKRLAARITIQTFHAFGLQLLQAHGELIGLSATFTIADEADQRALLKEVVPTATEQAVSTYLQQIARAKDLLLSPDAPTLAEHFPNQPELPELYARYGALLRANRLLDFEDLLFQTVQLLEEQPALLHAYQARYRWLSVDEYQDINYAQYTFLQLLTPPGTNFCAIGDPDQAIYGFRGAQRAYFQRFQQDFPRARILQLDQNYRSTQTILDAAVQVIGAGNERKDARQIWSDFVNQTKLALYQAPTDKAEAEYVVHQIEQLVGGTSYFSLDSGRTSGNEAEVRAFGDFAVLYRSRAQSRLLIQAFDRSGIPYQTVGQQPLTAYKEIRQIMAYLWLAVNPTSPYYQEQIYANARRKDLARIGVFLPRLQAMANEKSVAELIDVVAEFIRIDLAQKPSQAQHERMESLRRRATAHGTDLRAFLEALLLQKETDLYDARADRVTLMTLHAAKGLEFPVVFIVGCEEGLLPYTLAGREPDIEEERRLFYVGMTRAQQRLILLHARRRLLYGQRMSNEVSRFVHDIEETLKEIRAMSNGKGKKPVVEDLQLSLF